MTATEPECLLQALAAAVRDRAAPDDAAEFARRVDDTVDLADHGEAYVGFENLVANLHEFDVPITQRDLADIAAIAAAWSVPADRWSYVAEVLTDE